MRRTGPPPSIAADAAGDRLVAKEGAIFLCCRPDGDISQKAGSDGVYFHDTRYVSEFTLRVSGRSPVLLSSSANLGFAITISSTNPSLKGIPEQTLEVTRHRFINGKLYERVKLTNHGPKEISPTVEIAMASDFADTFEVRRMSDREVRGEYMKPRSSEKGFTLAYEGEDGMFRETIATFDSPPSRISFELNRALCEWDVSLAPGAEAFIDMAIEPSEDGTRIRTLGREKAYGRIADSHEKWRSSLTEIRTDNEVANEVVKSSERDLRVLITPFDGQEIMTAGIPWFTAPFGRDALFACYEMLMLLPSPALQTLRFLSSLQAKESEDWRDAEPGKILHELRMGELARSGLIPHTPYYGSVDSTPLFLMLCASYWRWTGDLVSMKALLPSILDALKWMDDFGDFDGDGFIEYERRSPAGLDNQGWKDSHDALGAAGSVPEGPIALAEVQGYSYLARIRIAELLDELEMADEAEVQRKRARELRESFNSAFWMPEEGFFAMALDGQKNQIGSITSNPGHCLYCGIIEPDKAAAVVERLMSPDMYSGWGVRTLSMSSPRYNPMSYHCGSVWPHDNAIIAAGMKRYGFAEATEKLATGMFEAASITRDRRLPELFCGFERAPSMPFVDYPVACSPQAWAAAAPFMVLQAMLGISARAHGSALMINQPQLPTWLRRVEIKGLRIGDSSLDLLFQRDRERTSFAVMRKQGDIRISMEE